MTSTSMQAYRLWLIFFSRLKQIKINKKTKPNRIYLIYNKFS
ncbi:hypothetical protein DSUL_140037 [Desulfovibrionales bacterium]